MKNNGIKAVIIRTGYGRESSQKDSMFESHYKNAKSENMMILECINNKSLDMPIYYDLEDNSQVKLGKTKLTEIAERFCETIKKSNYRAGVYANLNWFNNFLDYDKLKKKYSIWLAQYNSVNELNCDIWQNSSTGRVSGYGKNIDTNIIFNESVFNSKKEDDKDKEKITKPDIFYRVCCDGVWLPEVKNLEDYAGLKGKAITDIAIKVSEGKVWYQVHTKSGWLPKVRVYYTTPQNIAESLNKYLVAKYKVSAISKEYFDWQHDDQTSNGQDGYAGLFGNNIDRVLLVLE